MKKIKGRVKRHLVIRQKVIGTPERPRLCVFRSNKNIYVQLIDDVKGRTLLSLSTNSKELKNKPAYGGNVKAAALIGEEFAKKAKAKGFGKVVFDRAGYAFHGRVKALAESARKNGLIF
ncbi:MAG: 50S ribosomal protein L18 [Candidatus Omnitrophica bacterium]|nr:50S ribosomal protein L18 [Candidatus Omnitrophota bacterium]